MSFILKTEAGSLKYKLFPKEDKNIDEVAPTAATAKEIRERNELLIQLNALAKTRPFNVLFRAKKHETL